MASIHPNFAQTSLKWARLLNPPDKLDYHNSGMAGFRRLVLGVLHRLHHGLVPEGRRSKRGIEWEKTTPAKTMRWEELTLDSTHPDKGCTFM